MTEMKVKESTNIVQANFLIENRPKLTRDETRLFLTIVGAVNKDDEDFRLLQIPVSEFAELWGIESNAAYRKIKEALRGLVKKEFFIEGVNQKTGKMRFLSMSYLSSAAYEEGEGYATVEISKAFKPYLLEIKENYTRYILENVLNLTTVNAIRNYELLKQYEKLGQRSFTVEEYKKYLKIEDKYSRNTDLRVFVVEPAVSEINANTDIFVTYEFIGRGKKASIQFNISKKSEIDEQIPGQLSISEIEDPKEATFSEENPMDFFRECFERVNPAWNITDEKIEYVVSMIKDTIPYELNQTEYSLDIDTFNKLEKILKEAKAAGAKSIFGWLKFMFTETDILGRY